MTVKVEQGQWQIWNGDGFPDVRHDEQVIVQLRNQTRLDADSDENLPYIPEALRWNHSDTNIENDIIAYRVVREIKPIVLWGFCHASGPWEAFDNKTDCVEAASNIGREMTVRKFVEVLE